MEPTEIKKKHSHLLLPFFSFSRTKNDDDDSTKIHPVKSVSFLSEKKEPKPSRVLDAKGPAWTRGEIAMFSRVEGERG